MRSETPVRSKLRRRLSSPPLPYWNGAIGVLALSINYVLSPEDFSNRWSLVASVLNLVCLVAVPRFTLPVWAAYLLIFVFLAGQPDIRATVFAFFAPLIAANVAYRGHSYAAGAGCVLLWYSGSIDLSKGELIPVDLLASLVWGLFLAAVVLIGYVSHRAVAQREVLLHKWDTDVRARREALAQTLHDSVATSLTSVVMRAEALCLQPGIQGEAKAELIAIAEHARVSMDEVRDLLRTLNSREATRPRKPVLSVASQLRKAVDFLKDHGFTVSTTGSVPTGSLNADKLALLEEVLKEITINIVKYADPESLVVLTIGEEAGRVSISFSNGVSDKPQTAACSSGIGLSSLAGFVDRLGGSIYTISNTRQWTTQLDLSVNDA